MQLASPYRHHHIAFLHTSAQHVETFSKLMDAIAPSLHALHIVREDFLVDALQPCIGITNTALHNRIKRAAFHAADSGARVVVCTCSTIGGIVEALNIKSKKQAIITTRIDRAMADAAAKIGAPILLIATIESTIAPSLALLHSSIATLGTDIVITPILLRDVWAHFLAGNQTRYIDAIVAGATAAVANKMANAAEVTPTTKSNTTFTFPTTDSDNNINKPRHKKPTVVLAQASMSAAVAPLAALGITAFSSPELGVQHAVALYMRQQSVVPA